MTLAISEKITFYFSLVREKLFALNANPPSWKLTGFQLMMGAVCTFGVGALFLWWAGSYDREHVGKYFDNTRNYTLIPFDIVDATQICTQKTEARYGDGYVSSFVDNHSTRWDPRKHLYLIFMYAHVGNSRLYDEVSVHCFVSPTEYMVDHYRTFEPKRGSLIKRAIKIFTT